MPKFRARKTFRVGPLFFVFNQRGFTSWGVQVGRLRRNFTTGTSSFDSPGPGSVHWGGRRR